MALADRVNLGYIADSDEDGLGNPKIHSGLQQVSECHRPSHKDAAADEVVESKRQRIDTAWVERSPQEISDADLAMPRVLPTPVRSRSSAASTDNNSPSFGSSSSKAKLWKCKEEDQMHGSRHPEEGYTLRDLRRIISAMLPRYGNLLSSSEHASLTAFSRLPLRAQQLYVRLLGRKWPQWVRLDGLGDRYNELGDTEARAAITELSAPPPSVPWDLTGPTQMPPLSQPPSQSVSDVLPNSEAPTGLMAPWLLNSAGETAGTLLARRLQRPGECALSNEDSYGTLLLEAQPVADLRQFARSLGVVDTPKGQRGTKRQLLARLCDAARRQLLLGSASHARRNSANSTEARLVEQVLHSGHWVCVAPTPGREAMALLSDLFHLETSGAVESSFVVFSTRWPNYSFQEHSTPPLFADRPTLDSFLAARRFSAHLEQLLEKPNSEQAELDARYAEEQLQKALLEANGIAFEMAKFRNPFRRRFTAAWCWAQSLHNAVMHAPAIGEDSAARSVKIRQLRLLLDSGLCISRRGRWYSELAKEVARAEGAMEALQVAAEGIAEGEAQPIASRITVDLISEASSQEEDADDIVKMKASFPVLPQDVRWDLAKRCRALSQKISSARGSRRQTWQRWLRDTPAAQEKAAGSDDGGRWLPALVSRLLAEESAAPGSIRSISCTSVGLPSATASSNRRTYDSFRLKELTVEELAMQHYFHEEGFDCGIHCEGALLRDLFGILLYAELFDISVEGVFMSAYQDSPLDLGTEVFYPARRSAIEARLSQLAGFSSSELAKEVNTKFAELHGTKICGVRWDRYEGPDAMMLHCGTPDISTTVAKESDHKTARARESSRRGLCLRSDTVPPEACSLGAAASAIGGRALAAALRLLCLDYNSAGLPDLLVWAQKEEHQARARFVEVKSERDSLSRRQRLWLATLRTAGAEAEVCHVRDGPADVPSE